MKSILFHIVALAFLASIFWVPVLIYEGHAFASVILYILVILTWAKMIDEKWHM